MRKLIFAALLAVLPTFAAADTGAVSLTWTPPTQYADNSAMPSSAIAGYRLWCSFTGPDGVQRLCQGLSTPVLPGGSATSANITISYDASLGGVACFQFFTRTTAGKESQEGSNTTCKAFAPPAAKEPKDATNVRAQ